MSQAMRNRAAGAFPDADGRGVPELALLAQLQVGNSPAVNKVVQKVLLSCERAPRFSCCGRFGDYDPR